LTVFVQLRSSKDINHHCIVKITFFRGTAEPKLGGLYQEFWLLLLIESMYTSYALSGVSHLFGPSGLSRDFQPYGPA
jgi:hypothetical protein